MSDITVILQMAANVEFVCLFAYYHSQGQTYALEVQNQAQ